MRHLFARPTASFNGSALLIVLTFLLLLTALTVALLSRSTLERQLSYASFSQGKVALAGEGAIAAIIGDLQQEIVAGSNGAGTPTVASGFYYPNTPATAIPAIVGFTPSPGVENLIKVSKNGTPFYSGINYSASGLSRASSVNTYNNPSLNYRLIKPARWNLPLLMQPVNVYTTVTDFTPPAAFYPPDWIYVARDGSNPTSWSTAYEYLPAVAPTTVPGTAAGTNPVTQRYAYAIYDEGGTLDLNVAGSLIVNSPSLAGYSPYQPYKSVLSYADLTQLPGISTLSAAEQADFVDAIVCWRNYGSSNLANLNIYPNTYTVTSTSSSSLDQFLLFNPRAFLEVSGNSLFDTPNQKGNLDQTDNAFSSRHHLLQFFLQGFGQNSTFLSNTSLSLAALENLMPYLGTFSRGLSQPSYAPAPLVAYNASGAAIGRPAVLPKANGGNSAAPDINGNVAQDDKINPSFLNVVVPALAIPLANAPANASFLRNDGSWAIAGEPLVKKRFALSRLAWLTHEGPSGGGTSSTGVTLPPRTTGDADYAALVAAGIPASYLSEGTSTNIKAYFGLEWDSGNNRWLYDYHNTGGAPATGSNGPVMTLSAIASPTNPREPDFFELLKAGISVGSLGRALTTGTATAGNAIGIASGDLTATTSFPPNFNYPLEASTDAQIIQIGANIIDQYQTSGYPVRIAFDNGALPNVAAGGTHYLREYISAENYPYLYGVQTGVIPALQPAVKSGTFTTDGIGVVTQFPIVWNPYDPNTPVGSGPPTKFRILADQTDPDTLLAGKGVTNYLMCYATDNPATDPSGTCNSNTGITTVTLDGATFKSPFNQGTDTAGKNSTYQLTSSTTGTATGASTSNSAIDLTVTTGNDATLFREPTLIMTDATFTCGSDKYSAVLEAVPTDTVIKTVASTAGITGIIANPTDTPAGETPATREAASQKYLGFYLGAFPLAWINKATSAQIYASSAYIATVTGTAGGSVENTYITYRMQYSDPVLSKWVTYDTKYGAPLAAGRNALYWTQSTGSATLNSPYIRDDYIAGVVDPRTSRFGMFSHYVSSQNSPYNYGATGTTTAGSIFLGPEVSATTSNETWWLDTTNNTMSTFRMDASSGNWFHGPFLPTGTTTYGQTAGWNLPWGSGGNSAFFYPGLLEQNCTQLQLDGRRFLGDTVTGQGSGGSSAYYADPDGVVRRADAGYVPAGSDGSADTTMGLPMTKMTAVGTGVTAPSPGLASVTPGLSSAYVLGSNPSTQTVPTQNVSRPYILHRPFLSVAEIGYAFRGTPWKSVNFSMPESGDSALLDIFTLNESTVPSGLEAGKVDLNTRQPYVLAALLANAYLDDPETQAGSTATTSVLSDAAALAIANGIVNRTTDTAVTDVASGAGPFQNLSELVGKWDNQPLSSSAIVHPTGVTPSAGLSNNLGFIDGMLAYTGFSGMPTPAPGAVTSTTYASSSASPVNLTSLYTASSTASTFGTFPTPTTHAGLPEAMAYAKRYHEAPIRALVNGTQTRVWNLMIDVIAQTGRFPAAAATVSNPLAAFLVEGERRYWVHVAIDRYTGKVIDEQVEEVRE